MTISIQNVTFTYPGAARPVLRNLSLEIPQGSFVALIGNNGSGKTSLCRLLTGIIPHFFQGDFAGTVLVNGVNTLETRVAELARQVGYVYQDFESQLVKPRVWEDVAFAPLNYGMADYRQRAATALKQLGLSHLSERIVWELSGGEQHLVALAGALALDPSIIVVDEPISQLDPVNAEAVYERLHTLHKEYGKTIVVIEHHPEFIANYCDTVALLVEGAVAWHLPVREALMRVEELARHHIFVPQVTRVAQTMVARYRCQLERIPIRLEEGVQVFQPYAASRNGEANHVASSRFSAPSEPVEVAAFEGVSHFYELMEGERRAVLNNINLRLRKGERIALVGGNGAGKSTLLKMLAGLERPKRGRILVYGRDIANDSPERLADTIALVYQNPQAMFIEDSIRGDVAYYLKERRVPNWAAIVDQALVDFNLVEIQERDGRLLSGGQMRRASLAIGACMRPKLMLLDEPTANLDVSNRQQIIAMLAKLHDWVDTVVIATHDMELVAEWATRVVVLRHGSVLADAAPADVFGNEALIHEARIYPPQVVRLSNALAIQPVHLSVEMMAAFLAAR
ncbi:ABC transporter ATP-binding protein [Chloroflexus sp.]|uniref:ABC transporter ATP-binding protein n=1 Tax=Chloroflexus sp. TaxID=1904827 RepID=UPI002ACDE313|nr:ABC transporter ATP-binding protein [Chloroflexus sp.]